MLRDAMKKFVLVFCMMGLAGTSYAEVKFTPSLEANAFMGMYSNSEKVTAYESDGTTKSDAAKASHWDLLWKGTLGMTAEEGKMSGNAHITTKSYKVDSNSLQYLNAWVRMQATEQIAVKLDSALTPDGTIGFTATSGIGSELTFAKGNMASLAGYTDTPGLEVEYKPNPYMGVYFGLYAKDPLFDDPNENYGKAVASKVCKTNCDTTIITDSKKNGQGNGYSLSFAGALSRQLIIGGGYIVGQSDQYDGRAPWTTTAYQLSGKYKISDGMSITADYGARNIELWNDIPSDLGPALDLKVDITSMGLMFKINAGPGELAAIYHSSEYTLESGIDSQLAALNMDLNDYGFKAQETTLTYDIGMCKEMKKCGTKFIYYSENTQDNASGSDTNTKTWIGAEFYTRF